MFKVEENLILTKNAVLQDSFVVEDCGKYYEELSGFYVCLPKNRMDAIKQYMGTLNNSSFLLKIFDNNAVSGLSMLLQLEYKTSYTQEFVNYYGSVQGILESFAEAESDAVTNAEETDESDTSASQEEQFVGPAPSDEQPTDTFFEPTDLFVDETTNTSQEADAHSDESSSNVEDIEESTHTTDTSDLGSTDTFEASEELMLIIRGIAMKLGVIEYDDSNILARSDIKQAQKYVGNLSAETVREALIGAIGYAESREDLTAITRTLIINETWYSSFDVGELSKQQRDILNTGYNLVRNNDCVYDNEDVDLIAKEFTNSSNPTKMDSVTFVYRVLKDAGYPITERVSAAELIQGRDDYFDTVNAEQIEAGDIIFQYNEDGTSSFAILISSIGNTYFVLDCTNQADLTGKSSGAGVRQYNKATFSVAEDNNDSKAGTYFLRIKNRDSVNTTECNYK